MSLLAPDERELLHGLVDDAVLDDADRGAELMARVRWSAMTEPGDAVAGRLIAAYGAVEALRIASGSVAPQGCADLTPDEVERGRARWMPRRDDHRHPLVLARRAGARLIAPGDPEWPRRLDDLGAHAPALLWTRGVTTTLAGDAPAVAMVGARAATAYGVHAAAELAGDVATGGVVVVSGAAFGIDAAAHRATVAVDGVGIAVLAGGVEKAYPSGHGELLTSISRSGVVLSEVPCGTAPTKWRFLQRNRLIAALSDATIVVEAGWRSGSLNTAGHAAALGRPIGAVPGPITSPASAGCHRILREYDGICVTSGEDVREILGVDGTTLGGPATADAPDGRSANRAPHTDDRTRVIDALSSRTPRTPADIARRSGMAVDEIATHLGLLLLEARVERDTAGWLLRT